MTLTDIYSQERTRLLTLVFSTLTGEYTSPVFGEGEEKARLMFIGEAPGKDETLLSRPFVGKAGKQLDELLKTAEIDRGSVFVTNAVKYRPTRIKKSVANRTPSQSEIKASAATLKKEIELICPKIIATLGNSPLFSIAYIFGMDVMKIGESHGKCIELSKETILFPLYHPASVIYNRALKETLNEDIIKLGELYKSI